MTVWGDARLTKSNMAANAWVASVGSQLFSGASIASIALASGQQLGLVVPALSFKYVDHTIDVVKPWDRVTFDGISVDLQSNCQISMVLLTSHLTTSTIRFRFPRRANALHQGYLYFAANQGMYLRSSIISTTSGYLRRQCMS